MSPMMHMRVGNGLSSCALEAAHLSGFQQSTRRATCASAAHPPAGVRGRHPATRLLRVATHDRALAWPSRGRLGSVALLWPPQTARREAGERSESAEGGVSLARAQELLESIGMAPGVASKILAARSGEPPFSFKPRVRSPLLTMPLPSFTCSSTSLPLPRA